MVEIPDKVKLAFACSGIFFSFSYFAVLQEDVYKKPYGGEYFKYTFLALVCERGINAAIGALGVMVFGGSGLKIPLLDILWSGTSQMFAMAGSNEALRYVSYPTQVLGKSCKMVPVMAGGIILGGKRYGLFEYVQVIFITIGVVVFNLGKAKGKKGGEDSTFGLCLISFSLIMDAVTGGLQDKVKKRTAELNPDFPGKAVPTMHESMCFTNASGCLVALVLGIFTGHISEGVAFCLKNPDCMLAIIIYSAASAVGQNFIYYTVTEFGPLILTTVTTTRKIFTTLYSVFRNPDNSLTSMQWGGCMLVFVGLLCEVLESYMCPKKKKAAAPPPAEEKEPLTATGVVDEEEMRDVNEIELNGSSKPGYAKAGLNGHK
jgi:UDP-galactose transporter B1